MDDFKQIGLILCLFILSLLIIAYLSYEDPIPGERNEEILFNESDQSFNFTVNRTIFFDELDDDFPLNESEIVESSLKGGCRGLNSSLNNLNTLDEFDEGLWQQEIDNPSSWSKNALQMTIYDKQRNFRGSCTVIDGEKQLSLR